MRKYLITILLSLVLLVSGSLLVLSCEQPVAPGAEPSSLIPTANHTFDVGKPSMLWNRVYSLQYYQGSNNITFPASYILVGTTDTQTLTNKTLTLPIISMISNTGNITFPTSTDTLVGRNTNDTLTNKTLTSPSITSPTITGTSVIANHASGSDNISAGEGTVIITHGLTGTPTRIFLTYAGDPGNNDCILYSTSANTTAFTISTTANVTNNVEVYWLAYIADE